MKKLYLFLVLLHLSSLTLVAQNDAALSPPNGNILSPVSGCGLTSTETVTVRIFNFGPGTINTNFDVSFNIVGPVNSSATETVVGPNIPQNTYMDYTFTATADLSVSGVYTMSATVTLAGDPVSGNNTYSGYAITNTPSSVGGTVNSSTNVCYNSNSGTLTLVGYTGNILNWEFSTDGGSTWINISNTSNTQSYLNITTTTQYRALVQNGSCPAAAAVPAILTVDPTTVGGTVSPNATVCSTGNSGNVNLTGKVGNVLWWEYSDDGGSTWNVIANTSTTQSYLNLTVTTRYRARVQSGSCPAAYSSQAIITVNNPPVGGTVNSSTTVCASGNSGTLVLTGHSGTVSRWEYSDNFGMSWTNIANTTTTQGFNNLTQTRWYRALIIRNPCPSTYSSVAEITVDPVSAGGTVSLSDTVCVTSNSGTLTLSGETGTILNWEYSVDGGSVWNNIVNNTNSENYANLTVTTRYRVLVQSGICPAAYSSQAIITVDSSTIGGIVYGSTTVCSGVNAGVLTLSGERGSILYWQQSTDFGSTWVNIPNTTNNQAFSNLTSETWYRAMVQNGACDIDSSSIAIIYVDAPTVPGVVNSSATVCAGNNSGILNLTGNTGSVVNWEVSSDGGNTWYTLSNTTTSQAYNNLNTTTEYRVLVKSGVCPAVTSGSAVITVDPMSDAGFITGAIAGCSASNSGILVLNNYFGSITDWEESTDGGNTWASLSNTNSTQSYLNLLDTTWYRAIVQSGACPPDTSDAIMVVVYPKPVADFMADTVCLGDTTYFVNQSSVASGNILFNLWNFGDNNSSVTSNPYNIYKNSGTFNVELVVISDKSCSDTIVKSIVVNALPDATITPDGPTSLCYGYSVTLNAEPGLLYLWSDLSTDSFLVANTTGTYVLMVTDTLTGCVNSSSIDITIYPAMQTKAGTDTTISLGKSVELFATGGVAYSWLPPETLSNPFLSTPVASPKENTTYTVYITDINGCVDSHKVEVKVEADFYLEITNLITPNGDGFNDTWYIGNILNYPNNKVQIFNRYGNLVFSSDSYKNEWGGTYNNKLLPDGTYYYVLNINSGEKVYKGAVTLLKQE